MQCDVVSRGLKEKHALMVDDSFAIAVQEGEAGTHEYFKTSTLYPMLGTFAALLGDEAALGELNNVVAPKLADVNLERWYPALELETLTGSAQRVTEVGISRGIERLQQNAQLELDAALKAPKGAAAYEEFKWAFTPFDVFAAVSARLHRHPLPLWYVAMHAARKMSVDVPAEPTPSAS